MNHVLYLLSTTSVHPFYFPTPQTLVKVDQKIDEDNEGVDTVRSAWHTQPPVSRPCEVRA
jgi:hypothetical protein